MLESMELADVNVAGYDTLLLDRDGVINRLRPNDYVKCWEEFEFMPGVLDVLARWNRQVRHIFIVTNQRGIGRGIMTEEDLAEIHRRMCDEIRRHGGRIDKIYHCSAVADDDPRRKPQIGMFEEILAEWPDVSRSGCLMIGDSESDMKFAVNCGIKGVRL